MIEETAHVVGVEDGHAWVETERRSSCGSCSAKGCGTGALSKILGTKVQRLKVRDPLGTEVGDTVILGIEEGVLLHGSLMVYIVPLLLMLAGGLLGEALAPQWGTQPEGLSLIFGLLGLGGGFLWLRSYNLRVAKDPRYTAVILRKIVPGVAVKPLSMNL
jgi:sigma-E factor negative regulatory protein RseC